MTIEISYEQEPEFPFDIEQITETVIAKTAEAEQCPYEIEVYVMLTDNHEIQKINQENRAIDAPTDVLSFPMLELPAPSDFSAIDEEEPGLFQPDTGELIMGDIIISTDKVKEQAETYGHSLRREYAFLLVHSMLHLLGYDHIEETDRDLMEKRQKTILEQLGIDREAL